METRVYQKPELQLGEIMDLFVAAKNPSVVTSTKPI